MSALSSITNRTYDENFSYYQCDPNDKSREPKAPVPCSEQLTCVDGTMCCGTPYFNGVNAGAGSLGMCVSGIFGAGASQTEISGITYKCGADKVMASIVAAAAATYIMMQ